MTKEMLNEYFTYRDGILYWKKTLFNNQLRKGDIAGCLHEAGYIVICFQQKIRKASRLIYIMHYGDIPKGYIVDHKDRNRMNNKIENLRLATRSQNSMNRMKTSNNTSGYKGVYLKGGKWTSHLSVKGNRKHLGTFDTPELAYEAYKIGVKKYHKEFAYLD